MRRLEQVAREVVAWLSKNKSRLALIGGLQLIHDRGFNRGEDLQAELEFYRQRGGC